MNEQERDALYAELLGEMIRIETVSVSGEHNPDKFEPFHDCLPNLFPHIYEKLEVGKFDGSLLMRWQGQSKENPLMFMSHHDVVAATGQWQYPPFSGTVADGKLWGRGTLDTKGSLFAMLRAADELAASGFVPKHDIWFESACNEETDGSGADAITKELEKRGIRFAAVFDEGGFVLHDPIGGADADFAVVGVGEKGTADLKFVAKSRGGHASTPGKNTPLVRLGKFMAAVEKSHIFDVQLNDVTAELLYRCSKHMKGALGFLFRHSRLFSPLLCFLMPKVSATGAAMMRTTVAFTMAKGSEGTNVLPENAYVIGNMRFSHHQGQEASFDAIRRIAAKYDVEMEVLDPGFTSAVSDFRSSAFSALEHAVAFAFPNVETTPYIMTGASDCRYFSRVSDNCFRFCPFTITDEQLTTIHGIDENVTVEGLHRAVDFYSYLMKED